MSKLLAGIEDALEITHGFFHLGIGHLINKRNQLLILEIKSRVFSMACLEQLIGGDLQNLGDLLDLCNVRLPLSGFITALGAFSNVHCFCDFNLCHAFCFSGIS